MNMEIYVLEVINETNVRVNSDCGTFIGKWRGNNIPQIGKYCVEIDYNKIVKYEITDEKSYHIKNINGKNIICGFIIDEGMNDDFIQFLDIVGTGIIEEVINENNIIENHISGDGVIMINIEAKNLKNKSVKLEVGEIEIFPINC